MARLRKVQIGPGVAWVEAPDLGWSILCGCPADVVKSLKRAGLISEREIAGRRAETGPNAILLSDVMLQNGAFCNMAEFPVLQMLYRQGMILPGHPNNVGERPVLIGTSEQVDAQLHYIHRGNYGLADEQELLAAGVDADLAGEMLAYKMRFAFGRIRHASELLDSHVLDGGPVVLRGGLTVARTGLNQFEFTLGDERVAVDLTLGRGQTFPVPYDLPASCAGRDYFSVIHNGDGNGWDPERPSMGSVLSYQGRVYLIDAGPNVHYTLDALGIGVNEIVGLFHTHCHDDHFAGLTTLLRADHRLQYFATPLVRASVTKKLSALTGVDEEMFADCFEIHDLEFDQWNQINGLDVMPLLSPHPVETSVFLFRALSQTGYRTYAHWADIVARDVLQGMVKKPGEAEGISEAFFERVIADYARPADVKKIDVGGGLIHGQAVDFRDDKSECLLLSHLDRPLNADESKIGSAAQFGRTDVLIASNQDYDWRDASEFLYDYFPNATQAEIATLLNCPIRTDPPGTILLAIGEPIERLHLIVSGTVERVFDEGVIGGGFTAGSLLGEVAGLADRPAVYSYRCRSYVKSLVIPVAMMREFLRRNNLLDQLMERAGARSLLRSTQVCAEALAETTLTRLAQSMLRLEVAAGDWIDAEDCLGLVAEGAVALERNGAVVEEVGEGGVFNEERAMFGLSGRWQVRAVRDSEIALLPAAEIRQVPLLRWTLLEILNRRRAAGVIPFTRPKAKRVTAKLQS
jgi:hemerythrin